jgi:hypothetical protein
MVEFQWFFTELSVLCNSNTVRSEKIFLIFTGREQRAYEPAREEFGDLCPAISVLGVCLRDDSVFFFAPIPFLDIGIQVVMPANEA